VNSTVTLDSEAKNVEPQPPHQTAERYCLGCGYNLTGLGEEPRCPECGLLNIPQGYREEVWRLVDSGKWFFSSFFGPFKKRVPGWWWALDRPGDVRRSWKAVAINVLLAAAILSAACLTADLFKLQITFHRSLYDPNSPERKQVDVPDSMWLMGPTGEHFEPQTQREDKAVVEIAEAWRKGWRMNFTETRRIVVHPRADVLLYFGPHILLLIMLIWAYPATVGLFTQIRKGLPPFAMARRTIVSAANYESHQMIYMAILAGILIAGLGAARLNGCFDGPWVREQLSMTALYGCIGLFGMARWIGPVRSDYTRQLIQSQFHAARIVVLYALILPWATTLAAVLFYQLFQAGELTRL